MRSAIIVACAFSGLTAALPQKLNIKQALAALIPTEGLGPPKDGAGPHPVTYNPVAAVQSAAAAIAKGGPHAVSKGGPHAVSKGGPHAVAKGGPHANPKKRTVDDPACTDLQPGGAGPVPGNGSPSAYSDTSNSLNQDAQNAQAPGGYVESFKDLQASTQQIGYLTYKNIESGEYDVQECADFCNSEQYCLGFNIYAERDPKYDPSPACPDPSPITNIKCALYGYPVAAGSATNQGQYREQFQVVVTASNGYSKVAPDCKTPMSVEDFNAPQQLPGAINAPDSYITQVFYNNGPYNPSLCGAACEATTEYDREHLVNADGEYDACNFFTSYILTKNGVPLGQQCGLYTKPFGEAFATNTGYNDGSDEYLVVCPASYTLTNQDSGMVLNP